MSSLLIVVAYTSSSQIPYLIWDTQISVHLLAYIILSVPVRSRCISMVSRLAIPLGHLFTLVLESKQISVMAS
jgi:hypothetical protein